MTRDTPRTFRLRHPVRRGNIFRKRPVISDNTTSCSAARTSPSELAPCDSTDGFDDPELLALGHAILFKQCELGFGYPVAVSEVPEQAVITGHNRADFLIYPVASLNLPGSVR